MSNRRDFLKMASLTSLGLVGLSALESKAAEIVAPQMPNVGSANAPNFNMCGYAAPKIETVRIGFIGVGNRGTGAVPRVSKIEGVDIKAVSDIRPERTAAILKLLKDTPYRPQVYSSGHEEEWKKVCDRNDIDLIYIATPWHLHTPMALYAMEQGKHVCVEIPVSTNIEESWAIVETSERTKKHCVILENCCYDFFELLTLNMARKGFFGEIMHGEGAYIHDILEGHFSKTKNQNQWRLKQNIARNGNLYPTHGLGPVAQAMNINRGDQMDYLVSLSSNDFMMGPKAIELAQQDSHFNQFKNQHFRGNMNTTAIRTKNGKSIMLQHDTTSPRPYSRIHLLSGTKGTAQKYPLPGKISTSHKGWFDEDEMKQIEEKYTPTLIKKIGEMAKKVGGHGGMDFMMDWSVIHSLRNGLPVDMDVYDAALWSSIFPLSEMSINNRSNSVDIPDFTRGAWKTNKPADILLENS
jgi:predicted dehydrogenase